MNMIEKVARAMAPPYLWDEESWLFKSMHPDAVKSMRGEYLTKARAAIEAMREMVPVVRENGEMVHELRGSPASIWTMMFDAALA